MGNGPIKTEAGRQNGKGRYGHRADVKRFARKARRLIDRQAAREDA